MPNCSGDTSAEKRIGLAGASERVLVANRRLSTCWIVDSGARFDLVGSRTIRVAGVHTKNIAPQKLTTENGRIEVSEGAAIRADELGLHTNTLVMEESASVRTLG